MTANVNEDGIRPLHAQDHIKNYIKIDGIAGNSTKAGAEDTIEVLSWSIQAGREVSRHSANTSLTTGTLNISELTVKKYSDLTTPLLIRSCWKAEPIASVSMLAFNNEDDKPYFQIDITDATIAQHHVSEVLESNKAVETLTIAFKKIAVNYTDESGNVATEHDLTTGVTS